MNPIKAYRRSLAKALLQGPDALLEFIRSKGLPEPRDALLVYHKAVTGDLSLPIEFRRASKLWLDQHGFGSLDDGDL